MRPAFKLAALVVALIVCFALIPFSAADTGASSTGAPDTGSPAPVRMIGDTVKVCQLTGDKDWDTGQPTAARTFSNFGLDACDLGYPVEHNGKLIILFGDSWPPPHGGGAAGEIPPDDAVGISSRTAPPTKEDGKCLEITVHHTPAKKFAPAAIIGPTRVKQGFFNVPSGGVSVGGALYAFFWTNHCSDPNRLSPSPGDPLVRPPVEPGRDCPETDDRNSVGRGVLARSDDDGRTFSDVVPMPTGFVYTTAVNTRPQADIPADQRLGVFIFAAPRYRASVPYLAYAPVESFSDTATWRFFTGLGAYGQPTWVSRDQWNRGRPVPLPPSSPAGVRPPWSPLGEPELFSPKVPAGQSVGELSVTWNHVLHMWLMLYGGPGGMLARVARAPWGPWSDPTRILGGEDWLGCHLVMTPNGCGNRRDFWPNGHKNGKFVGGGLYAPYVLNRYTTQGGVAAPGGPSCTIYWVVSTWNPYEVSVMRTTLQLDGGTISPSGGEAQAGWKALEDAFAIPGKPGFFANLPHDKTPAAIWPQGQGIAAALDLAELSGNYSIADQMLGTLDAYRFGDGYAPYPQPRPPDPSRIPTRFYDDDGHVGLDLMQAYAQTGDRADLDKARSLFNFIKTGQHPEGGMLWCEKSDPASSAMSSTGSDTEFALRLYIATEDPVYLHFAEKNYRYMQEHFLVTRNGEGLPVGLYWGQVGSVGCPPGIPDPPRGPNERSGEHSYNQGYPIAIDAMFYRITGDAKYLTNAARTAAAALDHWAGDRLWQDAPAFNSILFRDLLILDLVAPNPAYRQALDGYLNQVWTRGRDPKTGLFDQGGIGHYGPVGNYLDQASLVELFALIKWPRQALERVAFEGAPRGRPHALDVIQ